MIGDVLKVNDAGDGVVHWALCIDDHPALPDVVWLCCVPKHWDRLAVVGMDSQRCDVVPMDEWPDEVCASVAAYYMVCADASGHPDEWQFYNSYDDLPDEFYRSQALHAFELDDSD